MANLIIANPAPTYRAHSLTAVDPEGHCSSCGGAMEDLAVFALRYRDRAPAVFCEPCAVDKCGERFWQDIRP